MTYVQLLFRFCSAGLWYALSTTMDRCLCLVTWGVEISLSAHPKIKEDGFYGSLYIWFISTSAKLQNCFSLKHQFWFEYCFSVKDTLLRKSSICGAWIFLFKHEDRILWYSTSPGDLCILWGQYYWNKTIWKTHSWPRYSWGGTLRIFVCSGPKFLVLCAMYYHAGTQSHKFCSFQGGHESTSRSREIITDEYIEQELVGQIPVKRAGACLGRGFKVMIMIIVVISW
jgi:hypothetical protein